MSSQEVINKTLAIQNDIYAAIKENSNKLALSIREKLNHKIASSNNKTLDLPRNL